MADSITLYENMHCIFASLISAIRLDGKSPVTVYKREEALQFFFIFSKQFLSYHKEGMKC